MEDYIEEDEDDLLDAAESSPSRTSSPTPAPAPTSGAVTLSTSATLDSPTYSSATPGENALCVSAGTVSITSGSVNKSGDGSDSPVFNAAVWVMDASLNFSGTEIISFAQDSPAFALAQLDSEEPDTRSVLFLDGVYTEVASGDTFYVTNTVADLTLSASKFVNRDQNSIFLRAESSSLGDPGLNGAVARLSLINQVIEGDITADSLSSVSLSFTQSYYMGALNPADSARSFSLTLDSVSNIILAGDSYLTSLTNADPDNMNIYSNGYKLYVAGEEVAVNGSEAPALPETVEKTEETPVKDDLETSEELDSNCKSSDGSTNCGASSPSIVYFILGGILISLAIVIPLLCLVRKKKPSKSPHQAKKSKKEK